MTTSSANVGADRATAAARAALDQKLRAICIPKQECIVGFVPTMANRHAFFLKRRRHLDYWNLVSSVYVLDGHLDVDSLALASHALIAVHDGLRLAFDEASLRENIVSPAETRPFVVIDASCAGSSGEEFQKAVERAIQEVQDGLSLSGGLFRVALITDPRRQRHAVVAIAHHLVVDIGAWPTVLSDLFALYRRATAGEPLALPPKTTALPDYAEATNSYWNSRAERELAHWLRLSWALVKPLSVASGAGEDDNVEDHTTYILEELQQAFPAELAAEMGYQLAIRCLIAIAKAFHEWTGSALCIAVVVHGREAFVRTLDLSRTVGWITDTVPLILDGSQSTETLGQEVRRQLGRAITSGKSHNVLKFCAEKPSELSDLPEPQLSLNIKLASNPAIDARPFVRGSANFSKGLANRSGTQRPFLLSGGFFVREDALCLSWDFSHRVLERSVVEGFSAACRKWFVS